MTETEWLASADPTPMLEFLRGKVSERKTRLFAVACCRRIWHLFSDSRCQNAVEIAESFADGSATQAEMSAVLPAVEQAFLDSRRISNRTQASSTQGFDTATAQAAESVLQNHVLSTAEYAAAAVAWQVTGSARVIDGTDVGRRAKQGELTNQTKLLRDIFGNPFRPVTVDPVWLTSTVVSLAQAIYEERAFDRLPILADALEDAGCTNADILNHCRQPSEHVRGCWCLDLLLDKK